MASTARASFQAPSSPSPAAPAAPADAAATAALPWPRRAFSPRLWRSWLEKAEKLRRTRGRIWVNWVSPSCASQASTAPQMASSCSKIGRDTSELQSQSNLVCRLLLEKKKLTNIVMQERYDTCDR